MFFIYYFSFGIYGVCVGGAYVEAQVSALLLSLALLPAFFNSSSLFLFSVLCFSIHCNFLIFLLHVLFVLLATAIFLEHLAVRCCKERMLRHVDSNSNRCI